MASPLLQSQALAQLEVQHVKEIKSRQKGLSIGADPLDPEV